MALTTRAVSWVIDGVDNSTQTGSISIKANVSEIVDTVDGIVYVQNTLTYALSVGQSTPVITTDNAGTNPGAGNWGYDITVLLAPGVPTINVVNVPIPSGAGVFSLAAMLAAAGL